MKYCAVCLIAKDETHYLREWAEYHLRIGFDALIVYDNGSAVPIRETLADLVALDRAVVHDMPGAFDQAGAYTDCILRYKNEFRWIAAIDADEFLFPKKVGNIKEFLAEYEGYGSVIAHWTRFGSSGRAEMGSGSQIFNFIHCNPAECTTVKSIVQPRRARAFHGPHNAEMLEPYFAVTSDHFPISGAEYSAPFVDDAIQINHYYFRTREDYERKLSRPTSVGAMRKGVPFEEEIRTHSLKNTDIIRFYSRLLDTPITRHQPVPVPGTVYALVETGLCMLEQQRHEELELMLCEAALFFEEDPMVWVLRAISARTRNNLSRAMRCIREALKLSGSSTVYRELERIRAATGDARAAARAGAQADYKKRIEDATCAMPETPEQETE